MLNGAVTLGTMDGANIEMRAAAGPDNMFVFGLSAAEVEDLWQKGYQAAKYYAGNERLSRIVNFLNIGFAGESFADIATYLLAGSQGVVADPYLCLADFESYRQERQKAVNAYADKTRWNRMSLYNIAGAGYFAADRAAEKEYFEKTFGKS